MLRKQWVLTAIWLSGFFLALLCIQSYVVIEKHGKVVILPEEREGVLAPVVKFYGIYLSGILACWFLKPFRPAAETRAGARRYRIAVMLTVAVNVIVLYSCAEAWSTAELREPVIDSVANGVRVASWLSFLVGPVNAYYFGVKPK